MSGLNYDKYIIFPLPEAKMHICSAGSKNQGALIPGNNMISRIIFLICAYVSIGIVPFENILTLDKAYFLQDGPLGADGVSFDPNMSM